jgi:calcineurin-like phosphoesterase family protein
MYLKEEIENLYNLYLDDLRKMVQYGDKPPRPRIRHPGNYARIALKEQGTLTHYKNIWCISDLHFGHKNIINYCNRPYASIEDMHEQLISNYNETIGETDVCIWGGDVSFMNAEKTNIILNQLNGDKILVIGNHDIHKKRVKQLDVKEAHLIYVIDDVLAPLIFTHFPMDNVPMPWVNIHGHTHNTEVANPHERHINICCENTNFFPVHLDDIKQQAKTIITSLEISK